MRKLNGMLKTAGAGLLAISLFIASPAAASNCSGSHGDTANASMKMSKDIVDVAAGAGSFETLVAAVQAAGLVDALKGEGPFTVFAPSDDAFAKLPKKTIENLLKPENRDQLTAILTYHVVPGRVPAETAVKLPFAGTLNGQRAMLELDNGTLTVEGANVVSTDIEASNGIIHVIDSVIMPASDDILQTATKAGSFKTLAAAVKAAGLIEALQGEGPFTVFAPTDDAFAALPAGTLEDLLKPENREQLTSILTYHVVSGRVYSDQALEAGRATTLQKGEVQIGVNGGKAQVNGANLVTTDIQTSNGVIHVIDKVLLPSDHVGSNGDVRDLIRMAIERGAPLYNHGQESACAAVYEVAAQSLMSFADLSATDRRVLDTAMNRVSQTHNSSRQAWILRDALDEVYDAHAMRSAMR